MGSSLLQTVKAVLVIDSEGKRLLGKYYGVFLVLLIPLDATLEQKTFEKSLFDKTKRSTSMLTSLTISQVK